MPVGIVGLVDDRDQIWRVPANTSKQRFERLLEESSGQMHNARRVADDWGSQAEGVVQA